MMINAGQLKHKITIQEFAEGVNENGYPVEDWTENCIVWSDIKTVRGQEFIKSSTEINADTYRFIIRYRKGLSTKMRIVYDGRIFDIQSILNDDEMKKTLTIVAIAQNRDDD